MTSRRSEPQKRSGEPLRRCRHRYITKVFRPGFNNTHVLLAEWCDNCGAFRASYNYRWRKPRAAKGGGPICMTCDGVGWTEGGPTLQTTCRDCGGTGEETKRKPRSVKGKA